jgi:DNA invertase Pin-like site-specific DNA recombinase
MNHELITASHLVRRAVIYIRQSSPHQVLTHQESLRLQYALRTRAMELGWPEHAIDVIDADLGLSAASAQCRPGFKELISQVTLAEVGIILSIDVTRLSRNCSDWYPLLDLCGYKSCLIADRDGVYDPGTPNGRLLLGLKGQISEMELYTLRLRLTAGLINKAQRGELALALPVGLMRLPDDRVVKDPDREVQERVGLVFSTFLEQRSAAQVLRTLREQGLSLPRRDRFGALVWRPPSLAAIIGILRNPAYAGAFVYGRTRTERLGGNSQVCRTRELPMDEWKICVRDKYPAYIDWSTFERIQAMLRDNYAEYDRNKTRGIPRPGKALLQGLVYCGRCGHKMLLQYKGGVRYVCNFMHQQFGDPVCQYLPADPIDARVLQAFFAALSPLELDAYAEARAVQAKSQKSVAKAQDQQLQRLRYQAALAERQFLQVDPDNRLVAGELESRWEQALQALTQAEAHQRAAAQASEPQPNDIAPELREAFTALGQRLPAVWDQGLLRHDLQKALLRCLIDKVVAHRAQRDQVHLRIVWKGDLVSTFDVPIAVGALADYSQAATLTERVLALFDANLADEDIASQLTDEGLRSPMHDRVLPSTVKTIRLRHGRMVLRRQSHPRHITGFLTASQVAKALAVPPHWLYDRIYKGTICIQRDPATRLYLFPDKPSTIKRLRELHDGLVKSVRFSREHQDA